MTLPTTLTFNDITGQTFGRWTVLSYEGKLTKQSKWLCQCKCGVVKEVLYTALSSGRSRSCGCSRRNLFPDTQP